MPIKTDTPAIFNPPPPEVKQSKTKWEALNRYAITELVCEDYHEFHRVNAGCHTRVKPNVDNIRSHIEASHHLMNPFGNGGGFEMKLRQSDKDVPLWKHLSEAGFEAVDFQCEICGKQIPFHPNHVEPHMKSHSGKTRRVKEGKVFKITISDGKPRLVEDEAFEENG